MLECPIAVNALARVDHVYSGKLRTVFYAVNQNSSFYSIAVKLSACAAISLPLFHGGEYRGKLR